MGNLTSRRTASEPSGPDESSSVPSRTGSSTEAVVPSPDTAAQKRTTSSQSKKPVNASSTSSSPTTAARRQTASSPAKKIAKKQTKSAGTKRTASSTTTAAAGKKRKATAPPAGTGTGTKEKKRTKIVKRSWDANYAQLVAFKKQNGHTRVPQNGEWKRLGDWLKFQYRRKDGPYISSNQLDQEKIDKLNKLGVDWIVNDIQYWDENYAQLQAFFKKNGHCNIPSRGKADKQLAQWVLDQKSRKHGVFKGWRQLNSGEAAKLESVGVQFD